MLYYLDLENVYPEFHEKFGFIQLDEYQFNKLGASGAEVRNYEMSDEPFKIASIKGPSATVADTMTEAVTPTDALYESMRDFADNLTKWDGEDMQGEVVTALAERLTPEARARLLFILLTERNADGELAVNTAGKQFAVVLAEMMGPDWAQWLYNFVKVVTKLA